MMIFQGSTRSGGGGGRRAANGQGRQPPQHQQHQPIQKPIVQNSLLDYFSTNPKPDFGEVDIDAALPIVKLFRTKASELSSQIP